MVIRDAGEACVPATATLDGGPDRSAVCSSPREDEMCSDGMITNGTRPPPYPNENHEETI